jgi:DNA end-binding protein Ku
MAPRANWKGFLRLSLVTCPVALYPATSDSEKISFNQLNRQTGHRIKYAKVDADTGEEVANEDKRDCSAAQSTSAKDLGLRNASR